jgi:hypothetical protein
MMVVLRFQATAATLTLSFIAAIISCKQQYRLRENLYIAITMHQKRRRSDKGAGKRFRIYG